MSQWLCNLYVAIGNANCSDGFFLAIFRLKFQAMAFIFNLHFLDQLMEWRGVCIFTGKSEIFARHKWKAKSTSSIETSLCTKYRTARRGEKTLDFIYIWSLFFATFILQTYPIKSIKSEPIGNNLTNTKGFLNIIKLLWSQTKPIFIPPLLTHTWKLCYLIGCIYLIGHGIFMW